FPRSNFQGNAIVGGDPGNYPANNFFPSNMQGVGFVNFGGGDFHLAAGSPLTGKGTSSTNPGANIDTLQAALNGSPTPVNPVAASRRVATGSPRSISAGVAGLSTATPTDANGKPVPGYRGPIHSSSSDSQAVLPADYTFTAADNGVHTFSATLKTAGTVSLTA